MAELRDTFECRVQFRMFEPELKQIDRVVKSLRSSDGTKVYSSISHYCRAAIMVKLREDIAKLKHGKKNIIHPRR